MEFLETERKTTTCRLISNQQGYSTYFPEHVLHFMRVKVVISDKDVRQKDNGDVRYTQKCRTNADTVLKCYTQKKGPLRQVTVIRQ
jgi:hypothetical protein